MQNRIKQVERVEQQMLRGWPDGTTELHRQIPLLLDRIRELEAALSPFGRAHEINQKFAGNDDLVKVYMRDCLLAREMIDRENSHPVVVEDFGIPAE